MTCAPALQHRRHAQARARHGSRYGDIPIPVGTICVIYAVPCINLAAGARADDDINVYV